jgi:hypothetical protein
VLRGATAVKHEDNPETGLFQHPHGTTYIV